MDAFSAAFFGLLAFAGAVAVSVISRLISNSVYEATAKRSRKYHMETVRLLLLSLAVWLLPRKERRRYSQEWFDYLCDPETAHKTRQALGFVFAAIRMDLLLLRRPANAFGKRALDVSFSVFGLIFLAPLLVLCALAVLISGPGPLIVQPKRIGLHGKQFSAFLLRAMHVDDPGAPDLARPLANERQVTRVGPQAILYR
jgi:SNF family Na+-dependent transporter